MMLLAIILIVVKGTGAAHGLAHVVGSSIKVEAATVAMEPTQNQMVDINSIAGGHAVAPTPSEAMMVTVQENSLVPNQSVLATLDEGEDRTETLTYEVQEGDTLSGIATDYGLTMQTLITANNLSNVNALKPGTELKIPPLDGILYTVKKNDTVSSIALKYKSDADKIISFNGLPISGDLKLGQEIFLPDGVMPKGAPTPKPGSAKPSLPTSQRFASLPKFEGFFIAPASGTITQRIHGRNGVDVANKIGTPIYAAASGVVNLADSAGYNGGYGKFVRITHANETETLYGHMSKIYVETGESVVQGQQIGEIGSTGRSTGPHVHFECHNCQNPLAKYVKGAQIIAKQ